jgi:hypothetical protein
LAGLVVVPAVAVAGVLHFNEALLETSQLVAAA